MSSIINIPGRGKWLEFIHISVPFIYVTFPLGRYKYVKEFLGYKTMCVHWRQLILLCKFIILDISGSLKQIYGKVSIWQVFSNHSLMMHIYSLFFPQEKLGSPVLGFALWGRETVCPWQLRGSTKWELALLYRITNL